MRITVPVRLGPFACGNFSAPDIAIDLGTAWLRACSTATAGVVEMPSWIDEPDGTRIFPMRGGVIVDRDAATRLLTIMLRRLRTWHGRPPNVLATVPTDVSPDEKDILVESLVDAGAGTVAIVPEPVAAAVAVSLHDADGVRMLIDIGSGVTDVALLDRGSLAYRASIRLGCAEMRDGVIAAAAHDGKFITRSEADTLLGDEAWAPAASAAKDTIAAFAKHAYGGLERSTRARLSFHAVCITGGGSLACGVASSVAEQLDVPVFRPHHPLRTVIDGARRLLDGDAHHVWAGFPSS